MVKKQYKKKSETGSLQCTLDSKHKQFTKHFSQLKSSLSAKKKELNKINKEIEKLDKAEKQDDYLMKRTELIHKKEELEEELNNIENLSEEKHYFHNTHNILENYYNNESVNNVSENNTCGLDYDENISTDIQTYYNFNNMNEEEDEDNIPTKSIETIVDKKKNKNMSDFIKTTHNSDKADLFDSYMTLVDKSYTPNIKSKDTYNIVYCLKCQIEKTIIQSEGILVCLQCGNTEEIVIDSEKPSYREPLQETSYFCYKRINHFNEWLSQFQAKESTEIPDFVYEKILSEIKKLRIKNLAKLTPDKMREILKKHKLNKYYEHVPHIINKLSGLTPPIMSREIEEKLRSMFKEIQEPFLEICPKDRKNFLSYSYVLHKMCELLGLDEFLNCFPLLKSREKLHNQDIMWKQITSKLDWQFIPSI